MQRVPAISAFFPAYNEEKNIAVTVNSALKILPQIAKDFEVIVVNDGSTDKTAEVANKITSENSKVRQIVHEKNLGYGAALATGFYSARFPLVVFTDADLQFDFGQIQKFLEKIGEADLVIGYRIRRAEGIIRKLNAEGWRFLNFLLFGLRVKDIDCGFKLIKKRVFARIPKLESKGATISAELLVKAKKAGFKILEIPVSHYPRRLGQPTGANLAVIAKAFYELFKLWRKLRTMNKEQ